MATSKGTILVTGANGGLGSAIVSQIVQSPSLAQDHHGLYLVRNVQRATSVGKALQKAGSVNHKYDVVPLDLASLASVRKVAADINDRVAKGTIPPIRALILNAGWQEYETQTITDDGFDMAYQTNYLSHFLLTLLLLGSMDKKDGRVLVLGSWSHDTADPRGLTGPPGQSFQREKYKTIFTEPWNGDDIARGRWSSAKEHPNDIESGYRRYGASKLCEVMMMRELSKRITKDPSLSSVSVLGLDPGAMPSGLGSRGNFALRMIFKIVLPAVSPLMSRLQPNGDIRTTSKSAGDVIQACFDTKVVGDKPNGVYMNGSELGDVGKEAKDWGKCESLWRDSLGYAEVKEGDTILHNWR